LKLRKLDRLEQLTKKSAKNAQQKEAYKERKDADFRKFKDGLVYIVLYDVGSVVVCLVQ
jgi:hypothetical protein